MPIDITDQYVHVRVKNPKLFYPESFRTQDFGRKGWNKRRGGILKRSSKWETQSYLVSKAGLQRKDKKTIALLRQIENKHGINLNKVRKIFNVS